MSKVYTLNKPLDFCELCKFSCDAETTAHPTDDAGKTRAVGFTASISDLELAEIVAGANRKFDRRQRRESTQRRLEGDAPQIPTLPGNCLADFNIRLAVTTFREPDRPGLVALHDELIAACDARTVDTTGFRYREGNEVYYQREALVFVDFRQLPLMEYMLAAKLPNSGCVTLLPEWDLWSLSTCCPLKERPFTNVDEMLIRKKTSAMVSDAGTSIVFENTLHLNAPGGGALWLVQHYLLERVRLVSATSLEEMAQAWALEFGGEADLSQGVAFTMMHAVR